MKNFKPIATGIDPTPLLAALDAQPELWREITMRQEYEGSAHADSEIIVLRGPASANILDEVNSVDFPAAEKLLDTVDIIGRCAESIGLRELGRVMLVKLKAGGYVSPHIDEGAYARYFARFHYVLESSPHCRFTCGNETVHMAAGELWWFNHQIEHSVMNDGPDRVHLILDAAAPGWTGALGCAPL